MPPRNEAPPNESPLRMGTSCAVVGEPSGPGTTYSLKWCPMQSPTGNCTPRLTRSGGQVTWSALGRPAVGTEWTATSATVGCDDDEKETGEREVLASSEAGNAGWGTCPRGDLPSSSPSPRQSIKSDSPRPHTPPTGWPRNRCTYRVSKASEYSKPITQELVNRENDQLVMTIFMTSS